MGISAVLAFFSTLMLLLCVHQILTKGRREILHRIKSQTQQKPVHRAQRQVGGLLKSLLRAVSRVFAARGLSEKVERRLISAGIPLKGEEGITLWVLSAALPGGIILIIKQDVVSSVLVTGLIALFVPLLVSRSQNRRRAQFDAQIGGALVVMANALRAGFSFFQTLEMISREMSDPIASEFRRVLREIHMGTSTEQAMVNLSSRVGSTDLDLLVTAVLIQRQVGGNLAEVLDNISGTIRERIRVAGEVKTCTAQGRISGMVIGLLPVALLIILCLIDREYAMTLFVDPRGRMILAGGVVSQIVGLICIKKVVDIKL